VLNESVGFGPFSLPAGQVVKITKASSSTDKRVANIGIQLFAAMNLKIRDVGSTAHYSECHA
jgi:hypothetical protein